MNPIIYCRKVGGLLGDYDEEAEGYDRDKYLVREDRKDALLANGCLPELLQTHVTDAGMLLEVSPQQVVDYITETIEEGRNTVEQGGKEGEFKVVWYPKLILLLLSNPGLVKLIKQARHEV